jgi:hypothetical protein
MIPEAAPLEQLEQLLAARAFRDQLRKAASPHFGTAACELPECRAVLEREVIARLDSPAPITSSDLLRALRRSLTTRAGLDLLPHLRPHDRRVIAADQYDRAFDRLANHVIERVAPKVFSPTAVAMSSLDDMIRLPLRDLTLWKNRTGVHISLWGTGPAASERHHLPRRHDNGESVALFAYAAGYFSSAAGESFDRQLGPVLRSLFRSSVAAADGATPVDTLPHFPQHQAITLEYLTPHLDFVSTCLGIFFGRREKEDTLDGRLRNAILLLAEADHQRHPAVALALCFCAIEAMLSSGTNEITATLSRNVAVLLEPPGANRVLAMKQIKKMYGIRSKVLHGTSLDHDSNSFGRARLIAAAALQAMLERRAFMRRLAGGEGAEAFFAELEQAQLNGKRVDGVQESAARNLWESKL